MIPILYTANETDFSHCGIGALSEMTSCAVTEERNGAFECEFKYPVDGKLFAEIQESCIVKAKPNEMSDPQLFRIYASSKPINGIVTYRAEHISYELSGYPVESISVENATARAAMNAILNATLIAHRYTAQSDIELLKSTTIDRKSARAALGGVEGSVLSLWGGEFEFDNFTVKLHKARGRKTGIKIAYGKNITDIKQEANVAGVYTAVYPYAKYTTQPTDGQTEPEEITVSLPEKILYSQKASKAAGERVCIKDFSESFNGATEITVEQLRTKAQNWVETSGFDVPSINITVSFENLWQSPEYEQYALLERCGLCDTVSVEFPALNISTTAKIIKTKYDVLSEKYLQITLGSARANFADTVKDTSAAIKQTKQEIKQSSAKVEVDFKKAIDDATKAITGQSGGYVVLNPAKNPQEILIMDAPTIAAAKRVWRWNSGGLGYSKNGYNGPFETAITQDGAIVADFITVGQIATARLDVQDIIRTGEIAVLGDVTVETERATKEEGALSSRITANATEIAAEVNRATDTEGALSSRITANAAEITAEVSRATDAEGALSSRITANATEIAAKVSTTGGAASSFAWSLTTSGFVLTSNNTEVMKVTSSGLNITGRITSTSGTIGGWIISSTEIYKGSVGINASNEHTKNSLVTTGTSPVRFYAGSGDRINGKFVVLDDGSLYASAAKIEGTITANSGSFSNCTIDETCTIKGTLTADTICNNDKSMQAEGSINFVGSGNTSLAQYNMRIVDKNSSMMRASCSVSDSSGLMSAALTCTYKYTLSGTTAYGTCGISATGELCSITGHYIGITADRSGSDYIKLDATSVTVTGSSTFTGSATFLQSNSSQGFFIRHNYTVQLPAGGGYAFLQMYTKTNLAVSHYMDYDAGRYMVYSWNYTIGIGSSSGSNQLYGTWYCNGSVINSSDRNAKNSIADIDEKYDTLFDGLRARLYRYNDGTSGRLHSGFVAQEVEEAMQAANVPTSDFAAFCVDGAGTDKERCGLRYEEFVSLNTWQIQKLKAHLQEVENRLAILEKMKTGG
jgi:phage minor structural protein